MSDKKQDESPDQGDNAAGSVNITVNSSNDHGGRSSALGDGPSLRILAFATAIPAVLIAGVGSFFVLQDNSAGEPNSHNPEGIYAALEQSYAGNVAASLHAKDTDRLIARLEESLKTNPNDVDGWRVLGWSHFRKQRYEKASEAYRRAAELDPSNPLLKSLQGEAMVAAADGQVTVKALNTFKSALALDPNNVRARFYSGQFQLQNGDAKSAAETWISLLKIAPEGEGWATDLRERILEVSRQSDLDVSKSLPPPIEAASKSAKTPNHASPTAEDLERASGLTPQSREAMARDMVKRLAARLEVSPDDPDGWIMLIRSRMVLGETSEAKAALEQAIEVFAANREIKQRIRLAAKALRITSGE